MRKSKEYTGSIVVVCAFLAGLAVGVPLRVLDAQVDDDVDAVTRFREALTSSPAELLLMMSVSPEGDGVSRVWYSVQDKRPNATGPVWTSVVLENNTTMVIGIGESDVPAFATAIPSTAAAESFQALIAEWRNN